MRIKMLLNQLLPQTKESIGFIAFKAFFKKELNRLRKSKKPTNCFIIHDFVYPDKPEKKLPIVVFGKPEGEWKKFMLGNEGIKRKQRDAVIGTCELLAGKEGETLAFTLKKGKARPKMLTRKINKFLMPQAKGFCIVNGEQPNERLYEKDSDVDTVIEELDKNKSMKTYLKLERAYGKILAIVAVKPEAASINILKMLEQIGSWYEGYKQLPENIKNKHQKEYGLIEEIERKFEKLLHQVQESETLIKGTFVEENDEDLEEVDAAETSIDNSEDYNDYDDEQLGSDMGLLSQEEAVEIGHSFAETKRELAVVAIELKKLKTKRNLSAKEQQQLQDLTAKEAALAQERAQETHSLFEYWKKEMGWAASSPREILQHYDNNWFKFKEALAYWDQSNPKEDFYSIQLAALEELLHYRKKVVDQLLEETKKVVYQQIMAKPTVDTFDQKEIKAFAFGSTTPTSDYDVTFQIDRYPQYEYLCVKYFNDTFVQRFGVNAGMLFDTNVYTTGFMPTTTKEGTQAYKDKLNPFGKVSELPASEKLILDKTRRKKGQIELALSLSAVLQYVTTKKEIQTLKGETVNAVIANVKKLKPQPTHWEGKEWATAAIQKELIKVAREDMVEIFKLAEGYVKKVEEGIKEKEVQLAATQNSTVDPKHLEAQAKDLLYVETLEKVSVLLEQIEANKQEIGKAKEAGLEVPQLFQERAQFILDFKEAQGKALMYANEAYFSGGPALHVVKGMQGGGAIKLGRQQKMQSMLMNIGYQLQHFNEQAEEHGLGRAVLGTSKYGQRVANLTERSSKQEQEVKESISGIHGKASTNMEDFMKGEQAGFNLNTFMALEDQIVSDYKKNDLDYPTPSSKDKGAEEAVKAHFPNQSNEEIQASILATFTRSAARVFGPYYVDKYQENEKRRQKDGALISPLTFW
ncbi:hypothetical protein [Aureispira anguillae]|uniref:Uncharacterized protein n=1 Tax=Aureispira anguillae TaxID=2864201 RepID=A0A915YBF0_9BACT|nr:hypothetical protein [Aureispira anguillae]BDS09990.1 hypothetical protein AsAng_0006950 [Aureispira anguillae]